MEGGLYIKLIVLIALLTIPISSLLASDSWQLDRLFNPENHHTFQESQGQVFIYDGLYESDINIALDEQFPRMENMMFIRTKHIVEGEVEEESDCD